MELKEIISLNSERGGKINSGSIESGVKSYEIIEAECRKYIQMELDKIYNKNSSDIDKRVIIKNLIVQFVMRLNIKVEGFLDEKGNLDKTALMNKLSEEITDYGILTKPLLDPDVTEIRINGREVKIERLGQIEDLTDENGNILRFQTPEQQDVVFRKLLNGDRLVPKKALVNALTLEGYRVAAIHSSVLSRDIIVESNNGYHAAVIRKHNPKRYTLKDLVLKGTLSDNMAKFFSIFPLAFSFVTVGPVSSGKTTLNNAILQSDAIKLARPVLIQNPSEIDLRIRDNHGIVTNDVLHLEAQEIENSSPYDPTMENLMNHFLRLSPTMGIFGEIRSDQEFNLALKIAQMGHLINTTFHAYNARDAIRRFMRAFMATNPNVPAQLALGLVSELIDIVIVQQKMRDNVRRVIQVAEVLDVNEDTTEPKVNILYEFQIDDIEYEGNSHIVKKIHGKHKQVGKLSEKLVDKLKRNAIRKEYYEFLIELVDIEETYTGNI